MIELIEIDQGFEPIEFDHALPVDLIQISDKGINRAKLRPNDFTDRRTDHQMSSLPITHFLDDATMVASQPHANSGSLSDDYYWKQYLLEQQAKEKLAYVAAARKDDKRLKYGVLNLKPYYNLKKYSLSNMIEVPISVEQELPCDINNDQISVSLPTEKSVICHPSPEDTAKVVDVIKEVKSDDDQFSQVQVTKALRNTKLRAKDIDLVLNYLSEVTGSLMHVEILKPATGRPPSPRYQIIWGKSEYFLERNKEGIKAVSNQNKFR